jgi:hypothetical protein
VQVRVFRLQLLELIEVAGDRLVERIGDATDARRRVERLLVVSERIARPVAGVRVVLTGRVRIGRLGVFEAREVVGSMFSKS